MKKLLNILSLIILLVIIFILIEQGNKIRVLEYKYKTSILKQDTAISLHRSHLERCSFIDKDSVYVDSNNYFKKK